MVFPLRVSSLVNTSLIFENVKLFHRKILLFSSDDFSISGNVFIPVGTKSLQPSFSLSVWFTGNIREHEYIGQMLAYHPKPGPLLLNICKPSRNSHRRTGGHLSSFQFGDFSSSNTQLAFLHFIHQNSSGQADGHGKCCCAGSYNSTLITFSTLK